MTENKRTILIVDDEKQIIELLLTHFRRRNYEPIATVNPKIVEKVLETCQVDLIILDLRMERRSGYEILQDLRKRKVHIPVIIMTAYFEEEKENLKGVGITENDVIRKPFGDFAEAEKLINKALNQVVLLGEVDSEFEDGIYRHNRTKIVIADDETEMNDILKEILEARRYDVKAFDRGDKALEYILQNECHVVVIDMKIPRVAGHELIKQALADKPALKFLPVSAAYGPEMRQLLSSVGYDPESLLCKPFLPPIFIERIKVLAAEAGTLGDGKS